MMGNNLFHIINNSIDNLLSPQLHIVMLGLDNSGKTTLLYKLKFKQNIHEPIPTPAFNVETIRRNKNIKFRVWDTAGHDVARPLWRAYVRKSDAMIFVIDSSKPERFDEARVELEHILNCPDSEGIPLLVLANKQDLPTAMPSFEVAKQLELDSLQGSVNWYLQPTSGFSGQGLNEALTQLSDMIERKRKQRLRIDSIDNDNNNDAAHHQRFAKSVASKFV